MMMALLDLPYDKCQALKHPLTLDFAKRAMLKSTICKT